MSLHVTAQHLAAHGRGPDDHLVHMSGREVAGLQALAQAHGGSLTKNPHTGLPEAGFLDSLLPTIVGAGLSYFSGGTIDPMTASMIVGGAETARSGDLGKGLMAGLGGYGGAGMMGGTLNAGAESIGSKAAAGGADQAGVKAAMNSASNFDKLKASADTFGNPGTIQSLGGWKTLAAASAPLLFQQQNLNAGQPQDATIRPYNFAYNPQTPTNQIGTTFQPGQDTSERQWFNPTFTALPTYQYKLADGGIASLAGGGMDGNAQPYIQGTSAPGVIEQMSQQNAVGQNTGYPQADVYGHSYATPWQTPISQNVVQDSADTGVNRTTGEMLAGGGIADAHYNLGGYSDGGRLLRGPGDGVSDSIPAQIGERQPARLADGEFVVPARIVSELGNGSTEAGARQLYKMMDRVQQARSQTTAKGKMAKNTNASKYLPA